MTTEQMDELDDMRRQHPLTKFTEQCVTQISFTDRSLDTMQITDRDTVRTNERGVYVTRVNYKNDAWTSFYPWTSVFSLTYA